MQYYILRKRSSRINILSLNSNPSLYSCYNTAAKCKDSLRADTNCECTFYALRKKTDSTVNRIKKSVIRSSEHVVKRLSIGNKKANAKLEGVEEPSTFLLKQEVTGT